MYLMLRLVSGPDNQCDWIVVFFITDRNPITMDSVFFRASKALNCVIYISDPLGFSFINCVRQYLSELLEISVQGLNTKYSFPQAYEFELLHAE